MCTDSALSVLIPCREVLTLDTRTESPALRSRLLAVRSRLLLWRLNSSYGDWSSRCACWTTILAHDALGTFLIEPIGYFMIHARSAFVPHWPPHSSD